MEEKQTEAQAPRELPRYRSHKIVRALKLKECRAATTGAILVPQDENYAPFPVSAEYVAKHNPQAGGYYVKYSDGYASWSPAEAFEDGYSLIAE